MKAMSSGDLDARTRRAYERIAEDFRRVFGGRFVALVVSPSGAAAAFVATVSSDDLDALGALAEIWRREVPGSPLVMTPDEFHRSLDTFPAEYQSLIDRHVVIAGHPPFEDVRINPDDLRRECEAQARGHLIHLRQGWIEAGSHAGELAELIERSAGPLRSVLTNLARLQGERPEDASALASFASGTVGMPEALMLDVLSLHESPHRASALVPRLPEYLAACERLWTFIDRWREK